MKRNVPMLYLFIERYKASSIKAVKCFAKGLERDIDAIENAVAYEYSNGFVEGSNSRLKMIKRTMYGRCGRRLLEAGVDIVTIKNILGHVSVQTTQIFGEVDLFWGFDSLGDSK